MNHPKTDTIQQEIDDEALFRAVDQIGRAAQAVVALRDPAHPLLQITDPIDRIIDLEQDPELSAKFVTDQVRALMDAL